MSITYTTARRKKICDYALRYGKMKAYELYGASRSSINRWLKRYDGTKASLKDYSRRPKSHPNQNTSEEVKLIVDLWHKNKEFGLDYLYGKLNMYQRKYNYLSPMEVWKEYKQTCKHLTYDAKANSSECK